MAINETLIDGSLLEPIHTLTNIIAALGGVIFLYLLFNIINFLINKKKAKEIKLINDNLEEIKKLLEKKKK